MNVLFEEDGAFRAGGVLADNVSSLQVELPGGRRVKVKAAQVLLSFSAPPATEVLAQAEAATEGIEIEFLWEVAPEAEFGFEALAAEYFGAKPTPVQAATVLLRLHSAPIYFHRKGRGRFRRAPPEILQAALAGLEKKRQQVMAIERMTEELLAGHLPDEFRPLLPQLLYAPDRNRPETKALEAAVQEIGARPPFPEKVGAGDDPKVVQSKAKESENRGLTPISTPVSLLLACGAVATAHEYHLGRFLYEHFREGTDFPACAPPAVTADLPLAAVAAFSIDDAATTEIDDAFSVTPQPERAAGGWRIGIHIAAPGLGFGPESGLGQIARRRLSTVYMPGRKITMLPPAVVEQFTLAAGRTTPALSLYLDVAGDLRLLGHETRLEQVPIVANLRHHDIEPVFNETTLAAGLAEFAWRDELKLLWEFATVLQAGRGKPTDSGARKDYNFSIDWDAAGIDGAGLVTIDERPRGSPLDTLVAELMIVANATWGALLKDAGIPALYRVQTAGKVRMSTAAAAHEGLGVDCYAWSSSPLRRYCDLLNQWQLIALLQDTPPPFAPKSTELFAALRDFELTYASYAEFQRGMERYWCLRWLLQAGITTLEAVVLKDALVRAVDLPLVLRLPSLPDLTQTPRGARVRVNIEGIDLLAAEAKARFVERVEMAPVVEEAEDTEDDENPEAASAMETKPATPDAAAAGGL
ncbi:MAG: RNB domain-containing ribonuclease [Rugosibacter sp.]|nr:RNB domain-containing ribonuclease [Rugosibacter sp.]